MKLFYLFCLAALQAPLIAADISKSSMDFESRKRLTLDQLEVALSSRDNSIMLVCADSEMQDMAAQLNISQPQRFLNTGTLGMWGNVEGFYEKLKTIDTFPDDFDRDTLNSFNGRVEQIRLALTSIPR